MRLVSGSNCGSPVSARKGPVSGMCFPWQVLGGGNLQGVTGDLFIYFGSYAYCRGFSVCVQLRMPILLSHPWAQ